jgi:p-cumate 2,3-dioxygenase beta subunit
MNKNINYDKNRIETFLFHEAELLDQWQLDEWLLLLDNNFVYQIPSNDSQNTSHKKSLFIVADDCTRTKERVHRLKDKNAHAEFPHSRTRRIISNVLVKNIDNSGEALIVSIAANFIIYRHKRDGDIRTYVGRYYYELIDNANTFKILSKKVILDAYELGAMGLISFIL